MLKRSLAISAFALVAGGFGVPAAAATDSLSVVAAPSTSLKPVHANRLTSPCELRLPVIARLREIVGHRGSRYYVEGATAPGDSGGGRYHWDVDTTAADNGSDVIRPTAGGPKGAWIRSKERVAALFPFGPVAQGVLVVGIFGVSYLDPDHCDSTAKGCPPVSH